MPPSHARFAVFLCWVLVGCTQRSPEVAQTQAAADPAEVKAEESEEQALSGFLLAGPPGALTAPDTASEPTRIAADPTAAEPTPEVQDETAEALPPGMSCLLQAYPEQLCSGRGGTDAALIWCDGTEMLWDSQPEARDFEELLEHPDLADMMAMSYPLGPDAPIPAENEDPGRVRYAPFFAKMYGESKADVKMTLTKIPWGEKTLRVTTTNGVDTKLAEVREEIEALSGDLKKTGLSTAGAFNWREVRGTGRLSSHSYAMAIDVGVEVSDFWNWNKPDKNGLYPYKNRFPAEIVALFEAHGFIWGGKWYHYDTMHFEYRPDLLLCGRTPNDDAAGKTL